MSKRFILSVAVAVLLGLVSAQAPPAANETVPVANETVPVGTQAAFELWNEDLDETDHFNDVEKVKCNLYDDYTYFDLTSLTGPYGAVVNASGSSYEVRFCGAGQQSGINTNSGMIFKLDSENNRVSTVAGSFIVKTQTLRDDIDGDGTFEAVGIKYNSTRSTDVCIPAVVADAATNVTA